MASIAILIRYLKAGLLLHDYVLHPQEACWVKCWQNERLSGAAVRGVVTATSPAMSRLSLTTDGAGTDYGQIEQTTGSIVLRLEEEKETARKGTAQRPGRRR